MKYRITVHISGSTLSIVKPSVRECWEWYVARVRPEHAESIIIVRID